MSSAGAAAAGGAGGTSDGHGGPSSALLFAAAAASTLPASAASSSATAAAASPIGASVGRMTALKPLGNRGISSLRSARGGRTAPMLTTPKPVNLPSMRSQNSGLDPNVALVPAGGAGWRSTAITSTTGSSTIAGAANKENLRQEQSGSAKRTEVPWAATPAAASSGSGKPAEAEYPTADEVRETTKEKRRVSEAINEIPAGSWAAEVEEFEVEEGPIVNTAPVEPARRPSTANVPVIGNSRPVSGNAWRPASGGNSQRQPPSRSRAASPHQPIQQQPRHGTVALLTRPKDSGKVDLPEPAAAGPKKEASVAVPTAVAVELGPAVLDPETQKSFMGSAVERARQRREQEEKLREESKRKAMEKAQAFALQREQQEQQERERRAEQAEQQRLVRVQQRAERAERDRLQREAERSRPEPSGGAATKRADAPAKAAPTLQAMTRPAVPVWAPVPAVKAVSVAEHQRRESEQLAAKSLQLLQAAKSAAAAAKAVAVQALPVSAINAKLLVDDDELKHEDGQRERKIAKREGASAVKAERRDRVTPRERARAREERARLVPQQQQQQTVEEKRANETAVEPRPYQSPVVIRVPTAAAGRGSSGSGGAAQFAPDRVVGLPRRRLAKYLLRFQQETVAMPSRAPLPARPLRKRKGPRPSARTAATLCLPQRIEAFLQASPLDLPADFFFVRQQQQQQRGLPGGGGGAYRFGSPSVYASEPHAYSEFAAHPGLYAAEKSAVDPYAALDGGFPPYSSGAGGLYYPEYQQYAAAYSYQQAIWQQQQQIHPEMYGQPQYYNVLAQYPNAQYLQRDQQILPQYVYQPHAYAKSSHRVPSGSFGAQRKGSAAPRSAPAGEDASVN